MSREFISLLAVPIAAACVARGDVIYSTLTFADEQIYDTANGNAYSGQGVFGCVEDIQAADDFVVPDGITRVTSITTDSLSFLGRNPAGGSQIDLWTVADTGGPGELLVSVVVPTTTTYFTDPIFGLIGTRITAADLDMHVTPGESYFIVSQPRDLTRDGDWYYIIRDLDSRIGTDGYFREPGRGCGQVWWPVWTPYEQAGYHRGDVGMEIRAIPGAASPLVAAWAGLVLVRRRRCAGRLWRDSIS